MMGWSVRDRDLAKISELTDVLRHLALLTREHFHERDKPERLRCSRDDLVFFAKTYLPHHIRDADNVGLSAFHEYLSDHWCKSARSKTFKRCVVAAPRGEAKSTYLLAFVLWCAVFREKHFVIYIMDTLSQAEHMLDTLREEVLYNVRLRQDFPDMSIVSARKDRMIFRGSFCFVIRGAGQRIRGLKFGARRPDLILLDDIENDQQVLVKQQRDKLQKWLEHAVCNLGELGASCMILCVGTVLHEDALLARLLKDPLWQGRKFSALLRMPDRLDMWDEWQTILKGKSETEAQAFYLENRAEMDKGAKLSWAKKRPLLELMKLRAVIGSASFNAEQQNTPASDSRSFGDLSYWCDHNDDWIYVGAVDPSLGKAGGDPCAILIGGINRKDACIDVIIADIVHLRPDKMIERIISYQQRYPVVT